MLDKIIDTVLHAYEIQLHAKNAKDQVVLDSILIGFIAYMKLS